MLRISPAKSVCFVGAVVICSVAFALLSKRLGVAESAVYDWANPSAITLQKISEAPGTSTDQAFYENTDCTPLTYRRVGEATMRSGCFMQTAFGMMEAGSQEVIFNGTDEAVPIVGPGSGLLVPMPGSAVTAFLSGYPTVGSYMHFYKYLPKVLSDVRDGTGVLRAKQITGGTDMDLTDTNGQLVAINPQTIAFSSNNSWMVVEAPFHSFIRINLATFEMKPFAPSFNGWAYDYAQHDARMAISDDGRYVAIASNEFHGLKVYDLHECSGQTTDLKPLNCPAHDYWLKINDTAPELKRLAHVRFVNNSVLTLNAMYPGGGSAEKTIQYELSPANHIGNLIDYLALGDSYTSGEGAFNYVSGTDTATNHCHLSGHSYPQLLTKDLFSDSSGHSVACSGAVIYDLLNTASTYAGQVGDLELQTRVGGKDSILANYLPGYVPQYEFATEYQPRILTVSIAGNNIGFGEILQTCVTPKLLNSTCYGTYEDQQEIVNTIRRTETELQNLYVKLRASAPNTTIYAIGYPQIAEPNGNCALNVHLNANELAFAQTLINTLDAMIQDAADKSGVTYVDISQALAGHKLCQTKAFGTAVNGLTAGKDGGILGYDFLGKESYHPNALGHQLIEQAIMTETHNFALAKTSPATSNNLKLPFVSAQKTGRKIRSVIHDATLTKRTLSRGKPAAIKVDGIKNGLAPNKKYTVTLGASEQIIGNLTSDEQGNSTGEVLLPADITPGYHTIDVNGEGQTGNPLEITEPVYVIADETDYDGDGIANSEDSCPSITNSGQDVDNDGIDDTCDDAVTSATNNETTSANTTPASSDSDQSPPPPGSGKLTVAGTTSNSSNQASVIELQPGTGSINPFQNSFAATTQTTGSDSVIKSGPQPILSIEPSNAQGPVAIKIPLPSPASVARGSWPQLPKIPLWVWLTIFAVSSLLYSGAKHIQNRWSRPSYSWQLWSATAICGRRSGRTRRRYSRDMPQSRACGRIGTRRRSAKPELSLP